MGAKVTDLILNKYGDGLYDDLSTLSIYYTVISWLRGEQSNYCPEVVEKIWEQQFPRSSQLPRDNGLTVPQVALK